MRVAKNVSCKKCNKEACKVKSKYFVYSHISLYHCSIERKQETSTYFIMAYLVIVVHLVFYTVIVCIHDNGKLWWYEYCISLYIWNTANPTKYSSTSFIAMIWYRSFFSFRPFFILSLARYVNKHNKSPFVFVTRNVLSSIFNFRPFCFLTPFHIVHHILLLSLDKIIKWTESWCNRSLVKYKPPQIWSHILLQHPWKYK